MLMALAFVMVIGLVIGALLTQSATQFKAERAFREQREGVFAADAGLEYAVAGIGMVPGTVEDTECTSTATAALIGGTSATNNGSSTLSISNFSIADIRGQQGIVIVAASVRGTASTPQVTLGSVTMTRLTPVPSLTSSSRTSTTALFYVLEANLPTGSSATITLTGSGTVSRVLYASRWTGVAQEAPTYASSTRGTTTNNTISTSVNAPVTGALVFSAASTSFDNAGMANSGAGTRLANVPFDPPNSNNEMQFGASYGIASTAGSTTVVEDFGTDANPATHVVLAAKPSSSTSACPTSPVLMPGSAVQANVSSFLSSSVTLEGVELSVASGYNRLLVVAVHGGSTASSVTFNGTSMTMARRAESGDEKSSVWYLLDALLPAPGDYDIRVTGGFELVPEFAVHASAWTGVLQGFGPTGLSSAATSGSMSSITTGVDVDTPGGLVFSAAGHDGAGAMAAPTGATRLTGGSTSSGAFGTSWAVAADATAGYQVTEAFSGAGTPTTHILLAFRPASWAPLEYGGLCEAGPQVLPSTYNGYTVTVGCLPNGAGDALTITSTAEAQSDGRVIKAHATVSRLPSGTIEITEWDTRPSDSP